MNASARASGSWELLCAKWGRASRRTSIAGESHRKRPSGGRETAALRCPKLNDISGSTGVGRNFAGVPRHHAPVRGTVDRAMEPGGVDKRLTNSTSGWPKRLLASQRTHATMRTTPASSTRALNEDRGPGKIRNRVLSENMTRLRRFASEVSSSRCRRQTVARHFMRNAGRNPRREPRLPLRCATSSPRDLGHPADQDLPPPSTRRNPGSRRDEA